MTVRVSRLTPLMGFIIFGAVIVLAVLIMKRVIPLMRRDKGNSAETHGDDGDSASGSDTTGSDTEVRGTSESSSNGNGTEAHGAGEGSARG